TAGNNRFDDVTLEGVALPGGNPPAGIAFESVPPGAQSGQPLGRVVVRLVDAEGWPAIAFNGPVTLAVAGGGTLGGTLTVAAVHGTAVFDDLVLTGTGLHQLVASAAGLEPVPSAAVRVLSLTGLVVPQFIQGGQDAQGENLERVPCAWRGRIDGLEPLATYRFANRVVQATDAANSDGAGNMIFVSGAGENWVRSTSTPSFLPEDFGTGHFALTADAGGSFTGWFVTEPTGNARFTPGNTLRFRLLLNDGAGGSAAIHTLTTSDDARVIRFGTDAGEGTAVIGQAAAARRIAVLFGDADGATRPLAATPVEITGAGVDDRYAAFYRTSVAPKAGWWGTILPNTLPGGLRRVEIHAPATAGPPELRLAAEGFPGTIDPAGGLAAPVLLVLEGYAAWLLEWFPEPADRADPLVSGPLADPSGDGVPNLMRYAHGVGPHEPVRHLLPRLVEAPDGSLACWLRFDPNQAELRWQLRVSHDLMTWPGVLWDSAVDPPPPPDENGWTRLPLARNQAPLFLRLELEWLAP
ncbi:MAG: hypothetical protein MUF04_10395, partial [Akkermansiaceae bacterium]|nr:hypothetical protein [Akkermansiaceae bacterium]